MEEEEPTMTINDVIQEEEESTAMVLGGLERSFLEKCTYSEGYLPRQALYLCETCYQTTKKWAGICYACSETCHADHDIIELHTKRNFRCDCGNERFNGVSVCQLCEEKDPENCKNEYNHNFEGLFCNCNRPYPDPEYAGNEEMVQCTVCEDWFHLEHMGMPEDFKLSESILETVCNKCVEKHPFLWLYYYSQKKLELKENEEENEERPAKRPRSDDSVPPTNYTAETSACRIPSVLSCCGVDKLDVPRYEISKLEVNGFKFPSPLFWQNNWRTETLCSCDSCKSMLMCRGIIFLLDEKDSVSEYMNVGLTRFRAFVEEREEEDKRMLLQLPRPQAIEFAHSVNHFKAALGQFLASESRNGVITKAAVTRFFEDFRRNLEDR
ncbi:unnamed protein product [Hymenolepis diminuta]|uniref:UBR-type domain-containing protein n=1 Tax=Hymenolepis diminuta TaxID=6216 RepID=A0A0R3S8T4_HYMDI|nr:unnamed protein product [Hymenolepis diminuta]VUZ54480.1 unnamed protein product [Hymenolepis diminuta]